MTSAYADQLLKVPFVVHDLLIMSLTNLTMGTKQLPLLFALIGVFPTMAQNGVSADPKVQASIAEQTCLLHTDPSAWASLLLTSDQLERVKRIQEACQEECKAAGSNAQPSAISSADGSTVIGELKNILSKEQYDGWSVWCASHSPGGSLGK